MIYLQNTKIIKDIEILQDLPQLETPVLSDIETGATITLGTQLSVSNMPTGATLYVNGSAVQGSTFTITPVATARSNGYNYTINLQYKGVSGYEDSEIASYTLKMKNPAPTVSLDSGVFTQSSKSITVTRQENVYESEQDQRCIHGEYDSTSEGTWCNVLMLSDTSNTCQFNFFIRETDYADRSDVVTRYYHIASSESMPTSTINYDENNENFTISVNNWPTDPVNGSYMSSDYTIYYSINDASNINTQYNSIAVSCSAGDVIRAKVVSGAGFADSATASYNVPVPAPTSIAFNQATYNINQGYTTRANNASFSAFTVTDNLGNDVTDDVTLSSANGMIILANNKHLIPITPGTDTITASYTTSAGTTLTTTCTVVSGNHIYLVDYDDQSTEATQPITLPDTNYHSYMVKLVDVNGNEKYNEFTQIFGNVAISSAVSSNTSVITAESWVAGQAFDATAHSEGSVTITLNCSVGTYGTIAYVTYFGYGQAEPEPSFNDSYTFSNGETDYASGDSVTIGNVGEYEMLFISDNGTCVTPDSTPTCLSNDTSIATITWSSDWGFDNKCGFTINAEAAGSTSVSMEMTIDDTTYNTTLEVIIPEPESSFSDNYCFSQVEGDQFDENGDVICLPENDISVQIWDMNNDDVATPDSTPTCSSDDDESVTISWNSNENAFIISALNPDLEIPVHVEVTIDGVTYNTGFNVFTYMP